MPSFGWIASVHYAPHLSDDKTASFSCLLGMPWASTRDGWTDDPAQVPSITQNDCEAGLGEWLAPWDPTRVRWQLWALSGGKWTPLGSARDTVAPLAPTHLGRLRDRCKARLHAHVAGHRSAMSFQPEGEDAELLTYPIVSPGLGHLPAPLSDQLLGTSGLLQVARDQIPANANIVALPVFRLGGTEVKPTGAARLVPNKPELEFTYDGPSKTVAGQPYKFAACVTRAVPSSACGAPDPGEQPRPQPISIRSRAPDRQLYATLTRQFWPLRLWLESLTKETVGAMRASEFCANLARLLGGGEDEVKISKPDPAKPEEERAVGSVFELVLPFDTYVALTGIREHKQLPGAVEELRKQFGVVCASPALLTALLDAFAGALDKVGLPEAHSAAKALASRAQEPTAAQERDLQCARVLRALLAASSREARLVWAAWLAAVLPELFAAAAPKAAARQAAEQFLQAMRDPDAVGDPLVEDDVLRLMNGQIDYAKDFWEQVHEQDSLDAVLPALKDGYVAALLRRVGSKPDLSAGLGLQYQSAQEAVLAAAAVDAPEADDPPLQLRYRSAGGSTSEEVIRGCILVLRVGIRDTGGQMLWQPPQWLTTFHAQAVLSDGGVELIEDAPAPGGAARPTLFSDTQGGTMSDGLAEDSTLYTGSPLFAAEDVPQSAPADALPEMFRRVPSGADLPPLAFGAYYAGVIGTVDNAGVIMEEPLRDPTYPASPRDAAALAGLFTAARFQYLSRQPPGAPVISGANDWQVGQETLSFHAGLHGDEEHRAAVLFSGPGYRDDQPQQILLVRAPSVGASFMERWLNTDLLLDAGHRLRWSPIVNLTKAQVGDLKQLASAARAPKVSTAYGGQRTQLGISHPAVAEIEFRVQWFSDAGEPLAAPDQPAPMRLPLRHVKDGAWLRDEHLKLHARQAATSNPAARSFTQTAPDQMTVVVPKGMRAKVQVLSVLPQDLLEGPKARFNKDALVAAKPQLQRPYVAGEKRSFVTAKPTSLWIESLPDVPADADLFDFRPGDFQLVSPQAMADPLALRLRWTGSRHAGWLAGVAMEQKRWQWSGYPVDLPQTGDLDAWLPLYAGTTDAMPALPDARFTTRRDEGRWWLDALVMNPVPLPAQRPASHTGLVVTGIPRFDALLADSTRKRRKSAFVYGLVRGTLRGVHVRLPAPVWQEAIPLPNTLSLDGKPAAPGNLIVLKDPMYDTADTARFGGIAERLELDVVAAWERDVVEAGPNPIFHKAPGQRGRTEQEQATATSFALEAPFGLGYDRTVGGRPAQTAAIVRPTNAAGQWVLAKCRLRRMVLPDLIVGGLINEAQQALLELRQVEDGWVPEDVAIYADQQIQEVQLGSGYRITMPRGGEGKRVYLVTWHRDRWAQAAPAWRPLAHLYSPAASGANWEFLARVSPYGAADFPLLTEGDRAIELNLPVRAAAHRIDVSDFTDSRWLSFIGSFGRQTPVLASELEVRRATGEGSGGYVLRSLVAGPMPELGAQGTIRASLLLIFAPALDIMRGRLEEEGGELVGVYAAVSVNAGAGEVQFDVPILQHEDDGRRRRAVVMQMQRRNVDDTSASLVGPKHWDALVESLFPREAADAPEPAFRLLPEYIGPIRVVD